MDTLSYSYLELWSLVFLDESTEDDNKDDDELGGLFRVLKTKSEKNKTDRASINKTDCSKFELISKHDWGLEEVGGGLKFEP